MYTPGVYMYDETMATPVRSFFKGGIYHVFNRGVEKRTIYLDGRDYRRFLETLVYYQQVTETLRRFARAGFTVERRQPPYRFKIIAYCLMANHFHLMLEQVEEGGITNGLGQILNSYTKYFNTRYHRVGHLFQGRFQAVPVKTDEQFVHLARYIMINPHVAGFVSDISAYPWSSAQEYFVDRREKICHQQKLLEYFSGDVGRMKQFMTDHMDYSRQLELIKHFPNVI